MTAVRFEPSTPFEGYVAAELEEIKRRLGNLESGKANPDSSQPRRPRNGIWIPASVIAGAVAAAAAVLAQHLPW